MASSGQRTGSVSQAGELSTVLLDRLEPTALAAVLAAQQGEWHAYLGWDMAEIGGLITESLQANALRGLALLDGSDPIGYGFFTMEPGRCMIGETYVIPDRRTVAANRLLAAGLLSQIQRAHARRRVESQSVHFDTRGIDEVFAGQGYTREDRSYLMVDLEGLPPAPAGHPRVCVRPWQDADFAPALEIIYQSYRGSVDARANSGYRTREGCADLLDALTNSVWCGRFDPQITQIAVDRATGRQCGVAIASRISATTAHLGQISVLPIYQGEGIGRALVEAALAAAGQSRLARASLAVTLANESAARLYEGCGFRPRLVFPVYFRDPIRAG
jgi:ribosomal protein S18 acetylase RimI-like enzyme